MSHVEGTINKARVPGTYATKKNLMVESQFSLATTRGSSDVTAYQDIIASNIQCTSAPVFVFVSPLSISFFLLFVVFGLHQSFLSNLLFAHWSGR